MKAEQGETESKLPKDEIADAGKAVKPNEKKSVRARLKKKETEAVHNDAAKTKVHRKDREAI